MLLQPLTTNPYSRSWKWKLESHWPHDTKNQAHTNEQTIRQTDRFVFGLMKYLSFNNIDYVYLEVSSFSNTIHLSCTTTQPTTTAVTMATNTHAHSWQHHEPIEVDPPTQPATWMTSYLEFLFLLLVLSLCLKSRTQ